MDNKWFLKLVTEQAGNKKFFPIKSIWDQKSRVVSAEKITIRFSAISYTTGKPHVGRALNTHVLQVKLPAFYVKKKVQRFFVYPQDHS